MLQIRKQTEYAVIALAYLAERPGQFSSAREIAEAYGLPTALLAKLLKCLHNSGLLRSVRGVSGGYQLARDLRAVSLLELDQVIRPESCCCEKEIEVESDRPSPTEPPLVALRLKMQRFLQEVKLSDLILPGRRIDVPLERVRIEKNKPGTVAGIQV